MRSSIFPVVAFSALLALMTICPWQEAFPSYTISGPHYMDLGIAPVNIPAGFLISLFIHIESSVKIRITDISTGGVILDEEFSSECGRVKKEKPLTLPSTGRYRIEEEYYIEGHLADLPSDMFPLIPGESPAFSQAWEKEFKEGNYLLEIEAEWHDLSVNVTGDVETSFSVRKLKRHTIGPIEVTFPHEIPRGKKVIARKDASCELDKSVEISPYSPRKFSKLLDRGEKDLMGDLNADGTVGITDVRILAENLGRSVGSEEFRPEYDLNGDGVIDITDLVLLAKGITSSQAMAPKLTSVEPPVIFLGQNYPNPFNPETWIPYALSKPAHVIITIFNAAGKLIRTLDLGWQREGFYLDKTRAAYWDGRDENGEPVSSGVYFYRLEADGISKVRKMIVMK